MELVKFIENLKDLYDEADPDTVRPDINFKDIEGYSSLVALSIIAMVDKEYKVKLKGEDLRKTDTISNLFELIKSRT